MTIIPQTYHIWTVGCQMNKADSESFAGALEKLGLCPAAGIESADVVVLNSCSVRQSAEQRILSKLGSLQPLKRRRPDTIIVLAGCMVSLGEDGPWPQSPLVDIVVPAGDTAALSVAIATRIRAAASPGACSTINPAAGPSSRPSDSPFRWVPIIHGCNQFCSYCIVPYRRGREHSRPLMGIVEEIERMVAEGAKEVTLLGQNVDAYGRDLPGRPDLADLLAALDAVPGLCRVRFLTSHPRYMSERLVRAIATLPKVCEHINLPVQSGDDTILKAMRRGYSVSSYRDLVGRIRQEIPGVSLSTDVIVGFPEETEEQFQHTCELLGETRFDVVHVAMYSPRPGTAAARLPDSVSIEEKKRRLQIIEEMQERAAASTNAALVGSRVEVLVEGRKGGKWYGRTRSNKLVFFAAPGQWRGWIGPVTVTSSTAWSLQGEPALVAAEVESPSRRELCLS